MHRTIRVRAKSMRISMLLTPICDKNLELAAQVGVEEIVSIFPGLEEGVLKSLKKKVDSFGMRLTHIERKIPHDFIERPGGHNWNYFSNSLEYHLLFFQKFFNQIKS